MNRRVLYVILTALAVLVAGLPGSVAQEAATQGQGSIRTGVDPAFTFQGHLEDASGPVSDVCDFKFELYDAANLGTQIGATQTENNVAVSDGKFTVQLDFGSDAFQGEARYLQIAVKCSGDAAFVDLTGRVSLTPSPYALSLVPEAVVEGATGSTSVLHARNSSLNGTGPGLKGETDSANPSAVGVYGRVTSSSPGVYSAGVRGENEGTGDAGIGVSGWHAGSGYGMLGEAQSGTGVMGRVVAASGTTYGVHGVSSSSGGIGVYGEHTASTGTAPGVKGETNSTSEEAVAVLGRVTSSSPGSFSAAVRGTNEGTGAQGIGVYAEQMGSGFGIYATATSGYAGYFYGPIYTSGGCTNCTLVYIGVNDGGEPLETGDPVAVSGVSNPLAGTAAPVLRVRRADASNASALLGVVQSRAQIVTNSQADPRIDSAIGADGPAGTGDHVLIVVQGLAQVKVDARAGAIQAGDELALAGTLAGHADRALDASRGLHIGRAMEDLAAGTGLRWVMVDLQ